MSTPMKLYAVSLDCPDAQALATFYADLAGWKVAYTDENNAGIQTDTGQWIFFQKVADYHAPQWPTQEHPQQLHLDLAVPRAGLADALRHAASAGARKAEFQPQEDRWTVFLDPAGHPFCVFAEPDEGE